MAGGCPFSYIEAIPGQKRKQLLNVILLVCTEVIILYVSYSSCVVTGMGRTANRGRGLLQTPFISPWQPQGFGLEEFVDPTYHRYMKGVKEEESMRNKHDKVSRTFMIRTYICLIFSDG